MFNSKKILKFVTILSLVLLIFQSMPSQSADYSGANYLTITDDFNDNTLSDVWNIIEYPSDNPQGTEDLVEQNQRLEMVKVQDATGWKYISTEKDLNYSSPVELSIDVSFNFDQMGHFSFYGLTPEKTNSWNILLRDAWTGASAGSRIYYTDAQATDVFLDDFTSNELPSVANININVNFENGFQVNITGDYNLFVSTPQQMINFTSIGMQFGIEHNYDQAGFYVNVDNYSETYYMGGTGTVTETTTETATETVTETQNNTVTDTVTETTTETVTEPAYTGYETYLEDFNDNVLSDDWSILDHPDFPGDTETLQEQNQQLEFVKTGEGTGWNYVSVERSINSAKLSEISIDVSFNFDQMGHFSFYGLTPEKTNSWNILLRDAWTGASAGSRIYYTDAQATDVFLDDFTSNELPSVANINININFENGFHVRITGDYDLYVSTTQEMIDFSYIGMQFGMEHDYSQAGFYINVDNYQETHISSNPNGNTETVTETVVVVNNSTFTELPRNTNQLEVPIFGPSFLFLSFVTIVTLRRRMN